MDVITNLELVPNQGAGALRFGMTVDDVLKTVGPADQVSKNHLNQRVEFRSFMNVAYTENEPETLVHVGFGRQMVGVHYKKIYLFMDSEESVLRKLYVEDSHPYFALGFVIFLDLGITLTGFHDADVSQKAVAMFPKGSWDKWMHKLKPFTMK